VFILGTAHCADMRAPQETDPESLTYAREVIAQYVAQWLAEKPGAVYTKATRSQVRARGLLWLIVRGGRV
jgi:hypothetical protein